MEGIKYYSNYDMSVGYSINRINAYFSAFNYDEKNYNLNQILEMCNILKFFDNKWLATESFNNGLFCKCLNKRVGLFFNKLNEQDVLTIVDNLGFDYANDFFECLVKFKAYEKIKSATITSLISQKKYLFHHLLENKELVLYYGTTIREIMLSNSETATLILDKYDVLHIGRECFLYLPSCLTLKNKEDILCNYINSSDPNLNYIELIVNLISNENVYVSNKTRLLAKRKCGSLKKALFDRGTGMQFGATVAFVKNPKEEITKELNDMIINCSYSSNWIEENLDYPTLLNNFIYLFEYVDRQMRCTLYSNKRNIGLFSRLGLHSKSEYQYDVSFIQRNQLADIELNAYKKELSIFKIKLEDIYEWFFSTYLKEEFNVNDFYASMPSKETTFFEKCKLLVTELESILKQYNMYVEEKVIDHELLEISSDKFLLEECKSLIKNKYVFCADNSTINRLNHLLFSDQCMLNYMEDKKRKQEDNFCDLILRHKDIKESDIVKHEIPELNWLIEQSIIEVNKDGYLQFKNLIEILILRDLYHNNTTSYWHCSKREREAIDHLASQNFLLFRNMLFTKEEADYISFYLNRSRFNNGDDLRNKYSHGTHPSLIKTKTHEHNYNVLLKLVSVLIIKINDDLCLSEKSVYKEYLEKCKKV